ncbi:hypothetical protein AIOL_003163 [Candidatus Rhodobacter oscarellae]|uniref:Uncharacterized protein n=1 Tax=Candidatus Rhodobacter oscarellae TaxID=1675527 RepID=A0A0J9E682_9RHOB|nr:M50 family metallopeptidase [Candidatus Rhodobacter lobularis]KMW58192.1 hypothetical protein AIOL_003163 [Candidatus Rhodobacter lobularis]
MTWLRGHWQLLALLALVLLLWNTPVLLPLKILVVLFHEVAHGLAAVLTGGEIVLLTVSADQGGLAVTRGGSRFLILTAGYLGSLCIGAGLLLAGLWSRADKAIVAGLGVAMLGIAILYIREWFAFGFCAGTGLALIALAWGLPNAASDMALRLIGLTSLIYVPRDIISDTIARAHLRSDAFMLGEAFFGSATFWGVLWLGVSIGVIALCARFGLREPSNIKL